MSLRLLSAGLALIAVSVAGVTASASGFRDFGQDIEANQDTVADVNGFFRARGELLNNLDLDRGLTPSGAPIFPVPLADPTSQTLTHADMRLRTDLALYAPVGDVAVKLRVDMLDNLAFGSTPEGPPATTTSQKPATVLNIERAYGEALTPLGLLTVGRMGSDWGLGMLTNGGDCLECDTGDAADRIAFISPFFGHIWAVAYDLAFVGPQARRPAGDRVIDLEPSDDVSGVTVAAMRYHTDLTVERRREAGRTTVDYGIYFSSRWQENDVPAHYLPTADPVEIGPSQVMRRGLNAFASDLWVRLILPFLRLEAEAALLQATIEEPSVLPGVSLPGELTSTQIGAAFESELRGLDWPLGGGIDGGWASGDAAPGFGAFPGTSEDYPEPGDLDGPQANPPFDNEVDNFRFHPDYHVDRILFREIIGTVTDAAYVRPHVSWKADVGPGRFTASLAAIASWAVETESTPSGSRYMGLEIDPTLAYESYDVFTLMLQYAAFFPGSAFDNPPEGLNAKTAQLVRGLVAFGF